MWREYYTVTSIPEALEILAEKGSQARLIAGATDLLLEMERGVRAGIDTLIDISRIPGLDRITMDEQQVIHLGPLVTHSHCVASPLLVERAFPLARAAWEVGAPQIRNRGTVAGNLITASPANDTIPPLMAMGAHVRLASLGGERVVPLAEFYTGVRRTLMRSDEMLVDIFFPALQAGQRGAFIKLGLRRAQAIAVVNAAAVVTLQKSTTGPLVGPKVGEAIITLGSVAPTIIHAREAEEYLKGRELSEAVIEQATRLAMEEARPIDDVRGSAGYRRLMVGVCVRRILRLIRQGQEREGLPSQPVLLWGKPSNGTRRPGLPGKILHDHSVPIQTRINGKDYSFADGQNKTLLHLLREEALLTGTKEGCSEGECGACTVFLDGKAVMSCMVPAVRAHGAEVTTIEALAAGGKLHPVQQAFMEEGAVQCGYCTPGFIMSGVKLLEENERPGRDSIAEAITGNLCRCTGYYKIIQAIERASEMEASHG